jgi:hypothetical protein
MWKFSVIELFTYHSWPFIDIPLQCSGNFKLKKMFPLPFVSCTVLLKTISNE